MASSGGFDDDPLAPGCYSQLLFADEITGLDTGFGFTSSFSSSDDNNNNMSNSPKMLCFGDFGSQCDITVVENGAKPGRKPGSRCTGSSSLSSSNSAKMSTLPKTSKKRGGSGIEPVQDPTAYDGAPTGIQRNGKKSKSDNGTPGVGHAKGAKKEKLGERITALQQLVSPFGKTDTASVLHEALGYIKFLQDQVQVLCSPYLQRLPPSSVALHHHDDNQVGENNEGERRKDDLRSRGLCLAPLELTLHVAESNGADLWSSAAMLNNASSC